MAKETSVILCIISLSMNLEVTELRGEEVALKAIQN